MHFVSFFMLSFWTFMCLMHNHVYICSYLCSLSHFWVLNPIPSPIPTLSPSFEKMSVSLTTDIQLEGESGPLIEPCSRGKTSPQPQGTKDGTGEGVEPEDSCPQDAQVGQKWHKCFFLSVIMCPSFAIPHNYLKHKCCYREDKLQGSICICVQ